MSGASHFFERLGLRLEVDLGVDVCRFQRDVPKPTSNGMDVDSGAQKVGRGGVADGMGADAFCRQRGHFGDNLD